MVADLTRMSRRSFGALTLGAAVATTAPRGVFAQDASPVAEPDAESASAFETLELPVLTVTANEFTFTLSTPGAQGAGWAVVNLVNESETDATVNLVQLPEGTSAGDLSALSSQLFQGEGGELPEWWSEARFAGGTAAAPGETSSVLVYLTAGQWSVFSNNPQSTQSPSNFRVLTPEELEANYGIVPEATPAASPVAGPAAPADLTADMTLTISDSGFEPSATPSEGSQVVEVINASTDVHSVVILHTTDEVDEASAASMAQSWVRGEETNASVEGGVGALSAGARAYIELTVDEGTHLLFSSMPNADGGLDLETLGVVVF